MSCAFCNQHHPIRNCNDTDKIKELIEKFNGTELSNIQDFLKKLKTGALSILMIHKYAASNVTMSKEKKMKYILNQIMTPASFQTQMEPELTRARVTEIIDDIIANTLTLFDSMLIAGLQNKSFIKARQKIFRSIRNHPEIKRGSFVATRITSMIRSFIYLYFSEKNINSLNPNGYPLSVPVVNVPLEEVQVQDVNVPLEEAPVQIIKIRNSKICMLYPDHVECMVCYEDIRIDTMGTLNCNHRLCCECIIGIISSRTETLVRCPYCRTSINEIKIYDKPTRKKFAVDFRAMTGDEWKWQEN
jgi:hypothetical protein